MAPVHQEELDHEDAVKERHLGELVGAEIDLLFIATPGAILPGLDPLNEVLEVALPVVPEEALQVPQLVIFHRHDALIGTVIRSHHDDMGRAGLFVALPELLWYAEDAAFRG